jgi:hypothetical protein
LTGTAVAIGDTRPGARFAWLGLLFGMWLFVGLGLVVWALNTGRTDDVGFSPYHVPFYLCLLALGATSLFLALRAARRGEGWTHAFPAGYGSLGAGVLVLLAVIVADVGWREGVGIERGIEAGLAPSRILLDVGLFLVLVAPFRAALRSADAGASKWPAVLSASLVLALTGIGGFDPGQNPWLEHVFAWPPADIWIMNSDGSHQTRLIASGEGVQAWEGVWSPNGREIAYTVMRKGDRPPVDLADEADIWIASADGTNARPVAAGERWQWLPHWSPDGVWIAYTDESEGGPWAPSGPVGPESGGGLLGFLLGQRTPERQPADIWRVKADGTGKPERLTDAPGDDRAATYSPDGTKLAFDSTRDGNTEIYVMDANGSNPRRLTNDPGEDWGATWSPDGRYIAFNSGRTGDAEIYVIGVDGAGLKRLTNSPGTQDFAPTWSPDGSRIVFRRDPREPGAPGEIWSMAAADGSDLRNLTQTSSSFEDIPSGGGAWGVDGRIIFARFQDPPVTGDPLIRDGLGTGAMLLVAVLLSFGAVVVRIRPPFGSFAVIMGVTTLLAAGTSDQWRFVPAAIAGGLIVDVLVRFTPTNRKAQVAGAGLASALVLTAGAAVVLTSGLGWSPTLLLGVAFASGALGWAVGGLVGGPGTFTEPGVPA